MGTWKKTLLGSLTAAVSAVFAMMVGGGSQMGGGYTGALERFAMLVAGVLLVGPAYVITHTILLRRRKQFLQTIPCWAVIHSSALFGAASMLLFCLITLLMHPLLSTTGGIDQNNTQDYIKLIVAAILGIGMLGVGIAYIILLPRWVIFLADEVFGTEGELSERAPDVLAYLLSYWAWIYRPRREWRKFLLGLGIHVVGGIGITILAAWFWNEFVDAPLGPIQDGLVPLLAPLALIIGLRVWVMFDKQIEAQE